jgi:hypothetical protein
MASIREKLLAIALTLGLGVSACVFAQKGGDNSNKRPPKDPPKVVVKETKPPPKGKGKP